MASNGQHPIFGQYLDAIGLLEPSHCETVDALVFRLHEDESHLALRVRTASVRVARAGVASAGVAAAGVLVRAGRVFFLFPRSRQRLHGHCFHPLRRFHQFNLAPRLAFPILMAVGKLWCGATPRVAAVQGGVLGLIFGLLELTLVPCLHFCFRLAFRTRTKRFCIIQISQWSSLARLCPCLCCWAVYWWGDTVAVAGPVALTIGMDGRVHRV
mmetsp:Transcript_8588/g.16627  ORF Transcript_8588/g.16627 Transcript_8588/m.16627 type:complete len:213 (-) Transcript_8588:92-730(-)